MANRQRGNKTQIEGLLSILYFGAGLAGFAHCTVVTIVWRYWKDVLNTCMNNVQCNNCILYATTLSRTVSGSDTALCKYVAFVPVPIVVWAVIIGSYHGYRACHVGRRKHSAQRRQSATFGSGVNRLPSQRHNSLCYSSLFLIAVIISIISIAISIAVTHGYYSTCASYKTAVVKYLSASGNLAAMVQERMTCGTVYDFLDYIQPDPDYLEIKLRRGTYIINTGLLLQLAIISSWLSVLAWVVIAVLNAIIGFTS